VIRSEYFIDIEDREGGEGPVRTPNDIVWHNSSDQIRYNQHLGLSDDVEGK
jgi:hypothetical protein